jgi:non-ribosomal peptide synthetase component F
MTLLAAQAAWVRAVTGATDLVLGTEVAGRSRPELEPVVGFFLNQIALRIRIAGGTFRELLAHVRDVTVDAYAHAAVPFDRVVEALAPPRSASHAPIAQLKMIFQNFGRTPGLHETPSVSGPEADPPGEHAEPAPAAAQLDQTWFVADADGGVTVMIVYDADLFEADTIRRSWAEFCALLDDLTSRLDACLDAGRPAPRRSGGAEASDTVGA